MNKTTLQAATIASLYIEALRQNQPLWFRVASNSMHPLCYKDDSVYIEPAQAQDIGIGEIAAFETPHGLVIHRIVAIEQISDTIRLLQMSDVEVMPNWVQEQAVVGRVVTVRCQSYQLNLQQPIAKWSGRVTAAIRYRLYNCGNNVLMSMVLRIASRLAIHLGYWCIRCSCASSLK
ncbi:MAG: S24/S26 family peptidase [Ktedonobacteraceae bacterium]